ncbi:MAG: DMT family transporter [Rikenellaceae bacterium]|jgi:drug/metabolite transporter (DMT)-like permease|nr:DMT family transporter [Rikenellaceae bacterium]
MAENYKGHIAMAINGLIFGLNIPVSKGLLSEGYITPFTLTLLRMCGAAALFWIVSLVQPREKVATKDIFLLFLASLFGIMLNQAAFIAGLALTSPINASIIATMVPIVTMLLAGLLLREPITWLKGGGVAMGAAGALMLILGTGAAGAGNGHIRGDLLCASSAISYSIYLTAFKPLIMRYSPVTLMKWMFLWAAVFCTPFGYEELLQVDVANLPWVTIIEVFYVVFLATFFTYMLIPVGQKLLRPTVVSMYNYMQPLVASLAAVALGIDTFGWWKATAGGLVFLGVWVVTRSKSRAQVEAGKAAGQTAEAGDQGASR